MPRIPALAVCLLVGWLAAGLCAQPAPVRAAGSVASAPGAAGSAGSAPVMRAPPVAAASSAPLGHRPLRQNQPAPEGLGKPTEPEVFAGYADAPAFSVVPRQPALTLYPCSACHKAMPPNPQPRVLSAAPHVNALAHGRGRMWCVDCHQANDRDWLRTPTGARMSFDQSHMVCGTCHSARHQDWYHGAHGKRVANWSGERLLYACTHCHDPHVPAVGLRAPLKAPPVRAGLQPMARHFEALPQPWRTEAPARP